MEIEFHGKYDRGEFFQAVAMINQPSRRSTIIRIGVLVVFVVIYILLFSAAVKEGAPSTSELVRVGRGVITTVIVFYFLFRPYITAYQTAVRLWKLPHVQDAYDGIVTSQGVTYNFADELKVITWDQFAKKQKTGKIIALLSFNGTLSLLPRSFFKSQTDWNTVLQWAGYRVVEAA